MVRDKNRGQERREPRTWFLEQTNREAKQANCWGKQLQQPTQTRSRHLSRRNGGMAPGSNLCVLGSSSSIGGEESTVRALLSPSSPLSELCSSLSLSQKKEKRLFFFSFINLSIHIQFHSFVHRTTFDWWLILQKMEERRREGDGSGGDDTWVTRGVPCVA